MVVFDLMVVKGDFGNFSNLTERVGAGYALLHTRNKCRLFQNKGGLFSNKGRLFANKAGLFRNKAGLFL